MKRVDYEKAWAELIKWLYEDKEAYHSVGDSIRVVLDKMTEIRKQCTKTQKKKEGK